MEYADKYKYIALAFLVCITALIYSVTDMVVKSMAMLHPSVKTIVVTRNIEKKNVVVREREVVYADGHRETEKVTEDKSVTDSSASNKSDSVPVIPRNPKGLTLWVGGGTNLDREYHATLGASMGPVLLTVDNPVWPATLAPRATLAVGLAF